MLIIVKGGKKGRSISRESATEHRFERRAKMLSARGYRPENIEAMMYTKSNNIRGRQIKKWLKHEVKKREMDLSGPHI